MQKEKNARCSTTSNINDFSVVVSGRAWWLGHPASRPRYPNGRKTSTTFCQGQLSRYATILSWPGTKAGDGAKV